MTSTFGGAFDKLDLRLQRSIISNLVVRKRRYLTAMGGAAVECKAVLLGDTPGPGRPEDPRYHHTPFYSTKNSSLWINCQLVEEGIQETDLLWFNTTLANGSPLDETIVRRQLQTESKPLVVCLGNNAKKWFSCRFHGYSQVATVFHPQAWKRFHSKQRYPLLDVLGHELRASVVEVA